MRLMTPSESDSISTNPILEEASSKVGKGRKKSVACVEFEGKKGRKSCWLLGGFYTFCNEKCDFVKKYRKITFPRFLCDQERKSVTFP